MFESLRIGNFKAIGNTQDVPLRRINLIYGRNSGGKSSILQALLLLKQSLGDDVFTSRPLLDFHGPLVDLGGFRSAVHGHHSNNHIQLGATIGIPLGERERPLVGNLKCEIEFAFSERRRASGGLVVVEKAEYAIGGENGVRLMFGEAKREPAEKREALQELLPLGDQPNERIYELLQLVSGREDAEQYWDSAPEALERLCARHSRWYRPGARRRSNSALKLHLPNLGRPVLSSEGDENPRESRIGAIAEMITGLAASHLARTSYLGPLRSPPERYYIGSTETGTSVGTRGELLVPVLLTDLHQPREDGRLTRHRPPTFIAAVNGWFRQFDIPYEVSVRRVADDVVAGDFNILELFDQNNKVPVAPSDVGFGFSQLLPVLVQGLIAQGQAVRPAPYRRFSTVCVEQPEIHLHPRLQAHFADFLISTAGLGDPDNPQPVGAQWIVETHSETLMLRLQRRIREGALSPADVSIIYVDPIPDQGSKVLSLQLDEDGDFIDEWPGGFFEEGYEEKFSAR
jgi:hypothetical protein